MIIDSVEMPRNWNDKVVFSITEFRDKRAFDIRVFYQDKEEEWHPTPRGVGLPLELFEQFLEKVEELKLMVEEYRAAHNIEPGLGERAKGGV